MPLGDEKSRSKSKVLMGTKRGVGVSSSKGPQQSSRKERVKGSTDGNSYNSHISEGKNVSVSPTTSAEYFCGPCLDEIVCKKQLLGVSEKDIEGLQNGPLIYK